MSTYVNVRFYLNQIYSAAIEKQLEAIKEKTPKKYKSIDQRVFVLISTVMTWTKTRPIDPVTKLYYIINSKYLPNYIQ